MNKNNRLTKKTLRAVIVEDEVPSQATLKKLLNLYCPHVEVIEIAATVVDAINAIDRGKPDLIFLDIALPDGDGFNVLENIKHRGYQVIFVTAYDKYAIRAFEFSALHYLLKPISHINLEEAVSRFSESPGEDKQQYQVQLDTLKRNINNQEQKIILPTAQGYELISLEEIIRLEANHNYTLCYLTGSRNILVSKSLINFENILDDFQFARVHNKHLVNLKFIKKYFRGSGGSVKMTDNSEINVSKSRKNEFLMKLAAYAHHL